MNPKFGKVFVAEQQVGVDGETATSLKLLESVRFSNINHKWYDLEGKLSPEYENYKGGPISLHFKIAHPDKNGEEVEFLAKVPLVLKLGELKPQDLESVSEASQKMIELWEHFGMLSGDPSTDENYRIVRDNQAALAIAVLCSGWKISDMKCYYVSFDPYFIQDDFIDKETSQKHTQFKLSHPYFSAMSDIVEGKTTLEEILTKFANLSEKYIKPLKGLFAFRNELAKKEQHARHVYLAFRDFHSGIELENCREWKHDVQKSSAMYKMLQPPLRFLSTGGLAAFEQIAFDQDVLISETIRESFLFKSLMNVFLQHCGFVNDLWSCKKEMAMGETSNAVYVYHYEDGLSLENAYRKTINKIAQTTQVVIETEEMFIALYGEEYKEAVKVVEIVKNIMYGNIQWSTITERYCPNIVYDFVAELG